MYGIATVGANGSLLTLVGTEPTVSGGNSMAPPNLGGVAINSALQPSTIDQPSDAVGLVSSGGASATALSVGGAGIPGAHQLRDQPVHSSASDPAAAFTGVLSEPNGGTPGVQLYTSADLTQAADDATLKNQVRCSYVKAAKQLRGVRQPVGPGSDAGPEHRRRGHADLLRL